MKLGLERLLDEPALRRRAGRFIFPAIMGLVLLVIGVTVKQGYFVRRAELSFFAPTADGSHAPVGDTDSERAFCHVLQSLRSRFPNGMPPRDDLFAALVELAGQISRHGELNFLLSSGDCLFAHCGSKLCYVVRQAPFAVAHLKDQDVSVDFSEVTNPDDRVAVIATLPLTDNEEWIIMNPATLMLFHDGLPVRSESTGA